MKQLYYLKGILLYLCLFTGINTFAYDAKISGIYYNLSENEATVTSGSPIYSGDVVIPASVYYKGKTYGVTCIGDRAFDSCSSLTSVTLPNSVTSIGWVAFANCSSLTSITIPNSVTSIGEGAFYGCNGLTSITIGSSVTSIGNSAFSECSRLTSITIPNSVTSIGEDAFGSCYLTSVTLESNAIVSASRSCDNSMRSIFGDIQEYVIGNSVTSIGEGAFCSCEVLRSVTIGNGVTSIGSGAFSECTRLTSINIPNSVTTISNNAFYNCSGLTSVTIGNSVTNIGNYAFSGCSNLRSITIPSSVSSIGDHSLSGCYFVSSSFVNNSSLTSDNNWGAVICDEETIDGLLIKYYVVIGVRPWVYSVTIPESVTSIGDYAFSYCRSLSSITIPNNVTSIGDYAFSDCEVLRSVTIGSSVTSIGGYAFSDCYELTSVTIGSSVTSIGEGAFSYCHSLTSVTIPNSVTNIGNYAFSNCGGLTSVTIPNSVTSIGEGAFYGCNGLTSITIGSSVTSIGNSAFSECSRLTTVKVDIDTPLAITGYTFSNRANATLIVPPGCKSAYEAADYWNEFKYILEEPNVITIGSSGYGTFSSSQPMDFTDISAFKAYIVSGFNPETCTLVLTRVIEVPAGEGLYIVGTPGTCEVPSKVTAMIYSNLLKGVTTATTISPTDGDYTNFILANGSHGVAFYSLSEAGELAAGKAYLQLPTASVSEVKAISVIFDDDEDAVLNIKEESQTQRIYNLQGQQVNAPKSGLYIINGKKIFIK